MRLAILFAVWFVGEWWIRHRRMPTAAIAATAVVSVVATQRAQGTERATSTNDTTRRDFPIERSCLPCAVYNRRTHVCRTQLRIDSLNEASDAAH